MRVRGEHIGTLEFGMQPIFHKVGAIFLLISCLGFLMSCSHLKNGQIKDSETPAISEQSPPREETSNLLHKQIQDLQKKTNDLIQAGEEAEFLLDYTIAISRYQDALKNVESVQALLPPYKIIKGELGNSMPFPSSPIDGDGKTEEEIGTDLKIKIERISGKIPRSSEPTGWENGIKDLVLQMVRRLPSEGFLTVIVADFREGRSGNRVPLSDLIESDIRTTMAGVEDIKVQGKEQTTSDLLLTGLFRMDGKLLRVNATLKDMKTGAITSAGRVLIRTEEIHAEDLLPQIQKGHITHPPLMEGVEGEDVGSYAIAVEQILTAETSTPPFNLKVWTNKNRFSIGEPVTFYFSADKDCYITLLDQGTSGSLRVIFPNPYQMDNFIHSGETYAVPGRAVGYEITVDGPPGIERVKAIASLQKPQLPINLSAGFYELTPQNEERMRDITLALKRIPDQQWTQGYLEIDILEQDSNDVGRPRKITPKRPEKPVDIIGTPGAIEKESPGVIEPKRPEKPIDILGVPGVKPDYLGEGD